MHLRYYQDQAVSSVYEHLRTRSDNPCVVIPTGGGKTAVMARICRDAVLEWQGRVLILAHVKELLQQSFGSLKAMCPEVDVGLYSSGLKRRDTGNPVVIAGIQSVWRRAADIGHVDLCLVDEAHLIQPNEDGMYREFLAAMLAINPAMRVVGLTATPYRMKSGMICEPENLLNTVCYEVGINELIANGYLCPLISKRGRSEASLDNVHVRGGEFIAHELESACLDVVKAACQELASATTDRSAVLVFTSGIRHCSQVTEELRRLGCDAEYLTGETSGADRDRLTSEFRNGSLKYLVNVNVLTTGFDAPNVDCVVLLRPTLSPGLYYQMCGRGFRKHPKKANCLVLDFGGNIRRHGPVDQILPLKKASAEPAKQLMKTCPKCDGEVMAGVRFCSFCGFMFPEPKKTLHEVKPDQETGVLSSEITIETYDVSEVYYRAHTKKGAAEGDPRTMCVEYKVGLNHWVSEWICFEHVGYARQKAVKWWLERSLGPVPRDVDEAVDICRTGRVKQTLKITTRKVPGEKWDRITGYVLGPMPEVEANTTTTESAQYLTLRNPCHRCGGEAGRVFLCGVHHTVRCLSCNTYQYHAKHSETIGIRISEDEIDESEMTDEEANAWSDCDMQISDEEVPF